MTARHKDHCFVFFPARWTYLIDAFHNFIFGGIDLVELHLPSKTLILLVTDRRAQQHRVIVVSYIIKADPVCPLYGIRQACC